MFQTIMRKLRFWQLLNREPDKDRDQQNNPSLSSNLNKNLAALKEKLGTSSDVIFRQFIIGCREKRNAAIIYLDGMADKKTVNESILQPLMMETRIAALSINTIEDVRNQIISVGDIQEANLIKELLDGCLSGDTAMLLEGSAKALIISTRGWNTRGIQEPPTEAVVRGPREGFTETLRTNTALLRRKIRDTNFCLDSMVIGQRTATSVSIAYLRGVTNQSLVEEIKRRLKRINTDSILESGYLEQFIEDAPLSPFSTISNSEKPDIVAAKILEGRAAILVDGTPFVLTVPMLFIESFQSPEDYYARPFYASILRALRFLAFSISILGPAVYVALTTYHQELIPTPLLMTMATAREGTPFPALVEALGMGIVFEILREAGIRLPKPIGQAISFVGALVVGDAAVSAGLIGAPMVIVVGITAIASFIVPNQADVGSILRVVLTLFAGVLGAFGIVIGLLGILVHLTALRSFGAPYFSPLAPISISDLKDTFVRFPLWAMFKRPRAIGWQDPQRQEFRLKPNPPTEGNQ